MTLAEQERLLEHQLQYLYNEILQLKKERYEIIYTASWHVARPLLWLEETLVGFARKFFDSPSRRSVQKSLNRFSPSAADEQPQARTPRRILIDLTGTLARDMGTGIERVTKDLSRALLDADPENCLLVRCEKGRLLRCDAMIASKSGDSDEGLAIEPGDQFLVLADAWNYPGEYEGVFDNIRRAGGRVIVCVHDVIPELYPAACHEKTVALFRTWLREILLKADGVLTVSRSSGEDLVAVIRNRQLAYRSGLSIGWFHNASRFEPRPDADVRPKISQVVASDARVFLCVGTLEPRKGHLVAIEAFEKLWAQGHKVRLVFVGKRGWFDYALIARITQHAEYGRQLFWFDDIGDGELSFLYAHMSALICPSFAEGFGLPVIEASRCGKPVICSDIPVFREIGGDGVLYFRLNDPTALAECIRQWDAGALAAHPERVLRSTWSDAAQRIINAVKKDQWNFRLA